MGSPCSKCYTKDQRVPNFGVNSNSISRSSSSKSPRIDISKEMIRRSLTIKTEIVPKKVDISEVLKRYQKKMVIIDIEGFKKVFLEEKDGFIFSFYIFDKSMYATEFIRLLSFIQNLPTEFDFFPNKWELFEDEQFYFITQSFPKDCKNIFEFLLESSSTIPTQVSTEFIEKLVRISQYTNTSDLSLILNPSFMYIDKEFRVLFDVPMCLINLQDRRANFSNLLFLPPEYISNREVIDQSMIFTIAAIFAFFFYDKLVFDKTKYENFLNENFTIEKAKSLLQNDNHTFFKNALDYNPKTRSLTVFSGPYTDFDQFCGKVRQAPKVALFLMSFAYFSGEFARISSILSLVKSKLRQANQLDDRSVHFLTLEQVVEDIREEIDPLNLESGEEFSKALQKSRRNKEYCNEREFLIQLKEEKIQNLVFKFNIINQKLSYLTDIELEGYLWTYESLTPEQRAEIVRVFKLTFTF